MPQELDLFRVVCGAIVVQAPRCGIARLALLNAYDDVAIPRPRVLTVVFARPRRRIGMRMIPPDQLEFLLSRRLFREADIVGGHLESVPRLIVPPIGQRQQVNYLA